jgi:hypothetical protein
MKLGHKLGLGCMGLIVAVFVLVMVIAIRNKPTPAQQAANDEKSAGVTAAFVCQDAVRARLKAPAGADFLSPRRSEIVTLAPGRYQIGSYVDAPNSFGAKIRTGYICTAEKEGAGFRVMKLDIAGR